MKKEKLPSTPQKYKESQKNTTNNYMLKNGQPGRNRLIPGEVQPFMTGPGRNRN